jgi:hypothetical protein
MAFSYYKSVTLAEAQSGTADSTNWTLTIAVGYGPQSADTDLKTTGNGGFVQNSNGYDIRPYSDSALTSALSYELVNFDGTNGKLEMYVKIPTLSSSTDTVIYLAFGDASISTDGSSTGAWDSNYVGVYHLPNGSSLTANDSTSTPANGTLTNTPTATTGQINGGANMVQASNQHISLGDPSKLQITGSLTLEAWVYKANNTPGQIIAKDKDTGGRAYNLDFDSTGVVFRFYINGGGGSNLKISGTKSYSTWYYVTGQYDTSGSIKVNVSDADPVSGTGADSSIPSATANALIGRREYTGFTNNWDGIIDEVRISNVKRADSWLTANYNCQKASSTFITWGTKTAVAGGTPIWYAALV